MTAPPRKLSLHEWDARYDELARAGLHEPAYGGPLRRHVLLEGDLRLRQLRNGKIQGRREPGPPLGFDGEALRKGLGRVGMALERQQQVGFRVEGDQPREVFRPQRLQAFQDR